MKIKVLMIDDHPSMLEGYRVILGYNSFGYELDITSALNCETAFDIINDKQKFDIVLLDYSLPPFEARNISNGLDLALILREKYPKTKLMVLTSHSEAIVLYDILNLVEPEGILVKSDFTANELIDAFEKIINGGKYRSATVEQNLKDLLSHRIYLDDHNRKIISLLAQGIKNKNLPNYINLSMSTIEKRKVQLKVYFKVEKGNDEDLIREAKKAGLV